MTSTLLLVALGTCLAGFVQGLSGFAFGLVAMGVWAWTLEPGLTAPLVVWGSWVGQILSLQTVQGKLSLDRAAPFVIGGACGVPVGVWLLGHLDANLFRTIVGLVLLVYCTTMLAIGAAPKIAAGGRIADGAIGAIGGVMGGIGGLTGPAPTLWCTLRGWDKDTQRATFQAFNLCMHSLTLAIYAVKGVLTLELLPLFGLMVPVAIVPTLAGTFLYRRLPDAGFRTVVLVLLALSGAMMLVASLYR